MIGKRKYALEKKIRVTVKNAEVRLHPDPVSPVVSMAPAGLIVQPIRKTGKWYFVELPPSERGDVIAGYIHESAVEEIKPEEFKEEEQADQVTEKEKEEEKLEAEVVRKETPLEKKEEDQEKQSEFVITDWIVFSSNRDDNNENDTLETDIYIMLTDGSEMKRLTNHPGSDWEPDLSPDGRKAVFVSDRDHKSNIYIINVDGTGLKRLTTGSSNNRQPTWSPDGKKILFISDRSDGDEMFVMNADGSEVSQLTDSEFNKLDPAWSPDGNKIAYVIFQEKTGYDIFVMSIDGSETTQVTDNSNFNLSPTWSPDGNYIAYECWDVSMIKKETPFLLFKTTQSKKIHIIYRKEAGEIEDMKSSICLIGADGLSQKKLTKDDSSSWCPSWSPKGQYIAFSSDRGNDTKIYIMNTDGSQVAALNTDSGSCFAPKW